MVRVVGQDQSVYKKKTCHNCASILEFVPADVKTKTVHSFRDSDTVRYIVCPTCQKDVEV